MARRQAKKTTGSSLRSPKSTSRVGFTSTTSTDSSDFKFNALSFPVLCRVVVPTAGQENSGRTDGLPRAKRAKLSSEQTISSRGIAEVEFTEVSPRRYYAELPSGPVGDLTLNTSKSTEPESDKWDYCYYLKQHLTLPNFDDSGLDFQLKIVNHPAIVGSNPRKSARTALIEGLHLTSVEARSFNCLYLEVFLEGSLIADQIIDFLDKDNVDIANDIYGLNGVHKLIVGDVKPEIIKFRPIFKSCKEIGARKLRFPPPSAANTQTTPIPRAEEYINECIIVKSDHTAHVSSEPLANTHDLNTAELLTPALSSPNDPPEEPEIPGLAYRDSNNLHVENPGNEPDVRSSPQIELVLKEATGIVSSAANFNEWEHPPPPGFLLHWYQPVTETPGSTPLVSPIPLSSMPQSPLPLALAPFEGAEKHDLGISPYAAATLLPKSSGDSILELVYWIGKETKKFYKAPPPPRSLEAPPNRRVCKHGKGYWLHKYPDEDSKPQTGPIKVDVAAAEPTEEEIESGVSERQGGDGQTTLMLYRNTHVKFLRSWAEPSIVQEIKFTYESKEPPASGQGTWIDGTWWKAIDEW